MTLVIVIYTCVYVYMYVCINSISVKKYSDDYKIFLHVLCHSVPLYRKEMDIKAVIQRTKFKFIVYKIL